ncbi:MAG: diaminopimelate epimerase [Myxococcota bacterium]
MERFSKYHGLGNDFVVIDRLDGGAALTSEAVVKMCDRHRGVGADGVLTVWPLESGHGRMQIQNADGSESENCGNGLRCVAAYLHESGRYSEDELILGAHESLYPTTRVAAGRYQVRMGPARIGTPDLPDWGRDTHRFQNSGVEWRGVAVNFGNPHLVMFVDDDPMHLATHFGAALEADPAFPKRVNASFVRHQGSTFQTVVYERGVGITQACGSGACAVGNAAVWTGRAGTEEPLAVKLPGGTLTITVVGDSTTLMEGDAARAFVGELSL